VAIEHGTESERILEARSRYVARGVAVSPVVVDRADGGRIWDVDGRSYIDFAGGIGCQNTGHNFPAAVAAIHEQVDRYLHQCFMVSAYEPYIEVCRRLAELSPCLPGRASPVSLATLPASSGGGEQRSILVNSGAEAIENAVKISRVATGRQAVVVFDYAFHGRTLLAMTMTSKVVPYKLGFGPFAPEVYCTVAPYPFRGVDTDEAIAALEHLFKADVDPASVACLVLETVQGEGGFIPMPGDFLERLSALCREHGILYVADEVQSGIGRTGPVWAVEHFRVEPDLVVSGKSLGGGLPLAGVTGRAEVVDAVPPGGLGGTFGGNPVACAAAVAVLDEVATDDFRAKAEALGARIRARLDEIAGRLLEVGEVRGLGPMLALELVEDPESRRPATELAKRTTELARERGLMLLTCGLYSNVLRVLVPILAEESDVEEGLEILEGALAEAASGS
jgi:4-aminobutyrate aminotransferase / (S)-3-amino-2-methylpropionate transaminase / 5-aminovalerate transaminase